MTPSEKNSGFATGESGRRYKRTLYNTRKKIDQHT